MFYRLSAVGYLRDNSRSPARARRSGRRGDGCGSGLAPEQLELGAHELRLLEQLSLECRQLGEPGLHELELRARYGRAPARGARAGGRGRVGLVILAPDLGASRLGLDQLRELFERDPSRSRRRTISLTRSTSASV